MLKLAEDYFSCFRMKRADCLALQGLSVKSEDVLYCKVIYNSSYSQAGLCVSSFTGRMLVISGGHNLPDIS